MASPTRWLFQFEDGTPLSFAVHEGVQQHDRLRETIQINRGAVTEDLSTAHFVILSSSLPGIEELLVILKEGGKKAIEEWWIRDSVDAGRLLPWYSYEIGNGKGDLVSAEVRDLHELVVAATRYSPIITGDELYEFVARKCPHLTTNDIRALHFSNKTQFDISVAYARAQLEGGLLPGGCLIAKPKLSFTSPNQPSASQSHAAQLVLQPRFQPQIPSPIIPDLRTPTSLTHNRSISIEERVRERSEGPEPGPNLDENLNDDHSSQFREPSILMHTPPPLPRSDYIMAETLPEPESISPAVRPSYSSSPNQEGVVMVDRPAFIDPSGKQSQRESAVQAKIAQIKTMKKPKRRNRELEGLLKGQYEDEKAMSLKERQEAERASKTIGMQALRELREDEATLPDDGRIIYTKFNAPTEADIEALAVWILENPRGVRAIPEYFGSFQKQYKGSRRSTNAWNSLTHRKEPEILNKMREILAEKKRKGLVSADARLPKVVVGVPGVREHSVSPMPYE